MTKVKQKVFSYITDSGGDAENNETREKIDGQTSDMDTINQSNLPIQRSRYCVYVILCDNNSLYIGQTNNLQVRWNQHCQGKGALWTKVHKPVEIVHFEEINTLEEAVKREKDLKTGFGRKWLKRLVAKKFENRLPAATASAAQAGEISESQARDMGK